ncbi:hypothetical protein HSIEG1_2425 [Enterococcus sp. HSIEG1]|nr:hypothetical protein HSIEG1_2425 [Enterococcus sp. HSIEG1]
MGNQSLVRHSEMGVFFASRLLQKQLRDKFSMSALIALCNLTTG